MDFRTLVQLPAKQWEITHFHRIMLFGSCFTDNIGGKLRENKFGCDINPYGVLYNPYSIFRALNEIRTHKVYAQEDLFFWNGLWHSNMHHTSFSNESSEECLHGINSRLSEAYDHLKEADYLVLTFGTAFYYELKKNGGIVGNCHKRPDSLFVRKLMQDEDNVGQYIRQSVEHLLAFNPKVRLLLTVSPIRHLKDGLHGNQLSKASLLLATDKLIRLYPDRLSYFPAYEIMNDELRDYRFYAEDMVHPSSLAIEYIWECFVNTYFNTETVGLLKKLESIRKAFNHKPFRPGSGEHKKFLKQLVLKIKQLKEKYPYLDTQKELESCHTLLNR